MQTEPAHQTELSKPHVVSVHNLVEFVLQSGDLTTGGFHKRDRAQAGTQGHRQVQRSRPTGYQAEVEVACQVEGADPPNAIGIGVYQIGRDFECESSLSTAAALRRSRVDVR